MVLYINGNYPHHSLHCELVSELAELGNEITVFVPMQGKELDGKYRCENSKVQILYNDCLKATDRFFFLQKIKRIVDIIEDVVDMKKVDCILAGTVYSDGFAAFMLSKKYDIPFSVAVRETDVTYHMKWRPYLNREVKHLLEGSSKIIFLSPAYQSYLNKFDCSKDKCVIIPNAVNEYWFKNQRTHRTMHNPVSLIYVGEISKRKNVASTISAMAKLNDKGVKTVFHIVGSGEEENNCRMLAKKLEVGQQVVFHGWQKDKERIKDIYDQADIFVMPSHRETFGTVYIEAMSQGLPIIYTKGQGIDGYFDEGDVGYGCNPTDIIEIANKVQKIIYEYAAISKRCLSYSNGFTWKKVSEKYNKVLYSMRGKW